jgi:hypothetical protein
MSLLYTAGPGFPFAMPASPGLFTTALAGAGTDSGLTTLNLRPVAASLGGMSNTFAIAPRALPTDVITSALLSAATTPALSLYDRPGFYPSGPFNPAAVQAFNVVTGESKGVPVTTADLIAASPFLRLGGGPISPLAYGAAMGGPAVYGPALMGNVARSSAYLSPARSILGMGAVRSIADWGIAGQF